jgi:RND family efflux transporter MFP subunit
VVVLLAALGFAVSVLGCDVPSESAGAEPTPVSIGPSRAALRVHVAPVENGSLGAAARLSGVIAPFREATVAAEGAGRVVVRHIEPGAVVAEGDPLVSLDPEEAEIALAEARATLRSRGVDLAEARRELARGDELRAEGALSAKGHDGLGFAVDRAASARALAAASLDRAERALAHTVVRAPFAGTVEAVEVQVGDYLMPSAPVATLADFDRVRLVAGVTAREAQSVRVGSGASVALPALGGEELEAEIRRVGRLADPATGTYPVELWLDNPSGRLRGGMVGKLSLLADGAAEVLIVPKAAVMRRGGRLAVFVVEGEGEAARAVAREVRLGREAGSEIEVQSGVSLGEHVVIDGQFALVDGMPVMVDGGQAEGEETAWSD